MELKKERKIEKKETGMLFDALNFLITLNSLAKSSLERYYGSFLMKCVILLKKEKRIYKE